jgi:antitoxin VapB
VQTVILRSDLQEYVMSKLAELFQNGSSQAVRLPREYRFSGDKVRIRRVGNGVLLEQYIADPGQWLQELKSIAPDPDFLASRRQPRTPARKGLG